MRVWFIVMVVVGPDRLRVDGRLKAARQDDSDLGDVVEKLTATPRGGAGVTSRCEASSWSGGPLQ